MRKRTLAATVAMAPRGDPLPMPRLLNINNYHYRRGGADIVYFEHAALFEALGWECSFFAMHHPQNQQCKDAGAGRGVPQ